MPATKTNKPVVQNGKVIPPEIIELAIRMETALNDEKAASELRDAMEVGFDYLLDIQTVISKEDMTGGLKNVAVAAVEAIGNINDNDEITIREMTEDQLAVLHKIDGLRSMMSTLVLHRMADYWQTTVPEDLRIMDDGTLFSQSFEDADE